MRCFKSHPNTIASQPTVENVTYNHFFFNFASISMKASKVLRIVTLFQLSIVLGTLAITNFSLGYVASIFTVPPALLVSTSQGRSVEFNLNFKCLRLSGKDNELLTSLLLLLKCRRIFTGLILLFNDRLISVVWSSYSIIEKSVLAVLLILHKIRSS